MNIKSKKTKNTPSDFRALIAEFINIYFDHNPESAKKRFFFSITCLFGIWILLVFSSISNINTTSLSPITSTGNSLSVALGIIFVRLFDPLILTRLVVITVAFLFAFYFSCKYLKTIYQLQSIKSAGNILLNLSFGFPISTYLQINDGQVITDNKNSSILSFGGPGKVRVGFDSVALFEKVDGSTGIISSTANLEGGCFKLKPYEKIRRVFNLKSHTISFDLLARTNDGVLLQMKNLRLTYSIFAGTDEETLTKPYPLNPQAIHWLVYHQPNMDDINLITDIVKTECLELTREYELDNIFPNSHNPSQILNHQFYSCIDKKGRERKRLHVFSRKTNRPIPQKTRLSQINLSRPILHHPHYPYKERNKKYPEATLLNTIPHYQLSATLTNIFKQEFLNHLEQPGIKLEWISLGTWTPLLSSIQINRILKKSFAERSRSDKIDNKHSNGIQHLLNELFNLSEYDEIYKNETDFNLFLQKILRFLKINSVNNESRSKHDQDIVEKAIINLERNLEENQK